MTDAQEVAIRRIQEIAREHFEAGVFVLMGTAIGKDEHGKSLEDSACDHQYFYHGGYATCVGLARMMERHIRKRGLDRSPRDPDGIP